MRKSHEIKVHVKIVFISTFHSLDLFYAREFSDQYYNNYCYENAEMTNNKQENETKVETVIATFL